MLILTRIGRFRNNKRKVSYSQELGPTSILTTISIEKATKLNFGFQSEFTFRGEIYRKSTVAKLYRFRL